jgi:hypothetical protein
LLTDGTSLGTYLGWQAAYLSGVGDFHFSFSISTLCIAVHVGPDCARAPVYKFMVQKKNTHTQLWRWDDTRSFRMNMPLQLPHPLFDYPILYWSFLQSFNPNDHYLVQILSISGERLAKIYDYLRHSASSLIVTSSIGSPISFIWFVTH